MVLFQQPLLTFSNASINRGSFIVFSELTDNLLLEKGDNLLLETGDLLLLEQGTNVVTGNLLLPTGDLLLLTISDT